MQIDNSKEEDFMKRLKKRPADGRRIEELMKGIRRPTLADCILHYAFTCMIGWVGMKLLGCFGVIGPYGIVAIGYMIIAGLIGAGIGAIRYVIGRAIERRKNK